MTAPSDTDLRPAPPAAPSRLSGLTVVLACHDEAGNLPDAVRDTTAAAERCAVTHEIVVIDDGSTDESVAVAGDLASRDPRVRLVIHPDHLGYGEVVRSGIAAARMPWVLLTNADLQFDVHDLEDFLPLARSADLVVGWRFQPQGPVADRAAAALWNRFLRTAFDLPLRDVDCAFRLARRELLEALDLRASGALVGAELLVKSRAAGVRTAEAPVHHRASPDGPHSAPGRRFTTRTLREIAGLRRTALGGSPHV